MLLKILRESELGKWYRLYTSEKSSYTLRKYLLLTMGLKFCCYFLLTIKPNYQYNNIILYY